MYALSAGGEAARRTTSNDWLAPLRFAEQEVIRHEARDGLELEGILIYPLDYERGRRYPLILSVHGGPEAHDRNGWLTGYSAPGQVAAARGFAVLYPNYRGSTGRGVEFSKISQADATGPEFDDLVDAVDHLIDIGLVDGEKVGITGGSYGGYASAWGTTYYSERFAASIPFVGISNAISKMGTTDIPQEMYDVHHRKWLWDDWEYFAKASPIYYVTRNRTPTLILHGEEDPRVHPSQSLELYRQLKGARPGAGPARVLSGRRARQRPVGRAPRLRAAHPALDGALPAGCGGRAARRGHRLRGVPAVGRGGGRRRAGGGGADGLGRAVDGGPAAGERPGDACRGGGECRGA